MGHIVEIMCMDKVSLNGLPIRKINKNEYVLLDTGEVKEFIHTQTRADGQDSLRRTFKKLRELINFNFQGKKNELAFTITYAENMTDTERLCRDFDKFYKRLRYRYPDIDYLNVIEPQERGAWHMHCLIRFNGLEKVYIPNKEIRELWGMGWVTIQAIKRNVDNLGAYLSAYLGDVELNRETIKTLSPGVVIKEVEVEGKKKKFIKGGRLHMYPPGMKIFRKSEGIKYPEKTWTTYGEAKKIVGAVTPDYSAKVKIIDDDGEIINSITYENYNLKRGKSE